MKKYCLPLKKWTARQFVAGCVLLLFQVGLAHAQSGGFPRGAQLPYTRYESEEGIRGGGATLEQSPQFNQNEIASEASNQKYVSLPANGSYVEWTVGQTVQGFNLRFTLPDNAAGTGQSGTLGLYVNGVKVQTISLSSYWAYQYFPQGQFEPVQTPGGRAFMRFDEVHFRLANPVTAGSKVRIAKDHGDALTYGVDFVELEPVPAPLAAPTNALSVTAYGAVANDQGDDYAAFTQCLTAAAAQGKNVYIPAGRFLLSDKIDLFVTNMKIQGAGIWHTELYFSTNRQFYGGFIGGASNVEISDLSINTANNGRFKYDEANPRLGGDIYKVYKGFTGTYGTGSRIHDVWVEHFECGFWIAGYTTPVDVTQDLIISRARIRNNYADGVNFCQGTSNSVVEYSSIRNGGDDGLAVWPNNANGAPAGRNNIFRYNTIENTWRAGGVALFGGTGHQVHNNIIRDGIGGSGIRLNTEFPGYSFEPNGAAITFSQNTITACGTSSDLWNRERGAIEFFPINGKGIYNIEFTDTDIINSQRHAIRFEGYQDVINNVVFNNTNVDGTGVDAFTDQPQTDKWGGFAIIANVSSGSATFNNITFNRLESGQLRTYNPNFIININNSNVALTGIALSPASVSLAAGATAPLTVTYSPASATNKALTWTSSAPSVATVAASGTGTATVTAVAPGSAVITVQSADGGFTKTSTVTVNPAVNIAATDAAAGEGGNPGVFTISTPATNANLTVAYAVSGTAASADYAATPALSGSVTLTPAAPSQTITIAPTDDSSVEGAESLTLTLQPGTGFSLGASPAATVSIADNDNPPCAAPVIAFTTTAPAIDQAIDAAWNNAPAGTLNKVTLGTLPPDFAGSRWRALYDNTNLYVLVEVKDNAKYNDSGTSWWEDDAVELFIDGNNSKGTTYDGVNDFQFGFRHNDATVHVGGSSVNRTTGVQFAVQNVTGGYNVEVRIPWATIGVSPAAGNQIGFEVEVDDDDNGAARDAQVAAFASVSGAFSNPSLFGTVSLTTCGGTPTPAPVITSSGTAAGTAGAGFSYTIAASNSPTGFGATGLPAGLAVNATSGLISGTPTTAGTYNATLSATNAGGTGTQALTLTIANAPAQAPVINSSLTAASSIGSNFSYTITATNSPGSFNATGLPTGLSVNTATGVISGSPTQSGTRNVTLAASNAAGTDTKTLVLSVTEPAGVVACYRAPGTLTVNGSLGETGWNLSKSVAKNTIGTGNNTVTFGVLWDNTYLYVGARVLDANLFSDSPDAWEDDAIEIMVDANNNKSTTYDGADNQIIKNYNKSTVQTKLPISGLLHAWAAISGGYSVEVAIPWSQLGIAAPANGTSIGFDVGYDDDDNGGSRDAQAVWNGTIDNYQNTAAFGKLVLSSANAGARAAAGPAESLQVVLLPNPVTHGQVQVLVPSAAGEVYVQVVDMQGRTVLRQRQPANRITLHVAHLAKGVYLALVHTEGKLVTKKFVVE